MESKKIDYLEVLFWILTIVVLLWVIYEVVKEIAKGEQDLESRIQQDTAWMNLSEETSLRLSRIATLHYRLIIGFIILFLGGCVLGLVYVNFTYVDSIEIVFGTGGILVSGICAILYRKFGPDVLLELLKRSMLERLYRRNNIKVSTDGRAYLTEHYIRANDVSGNGSVIEKKN